MAIIGLTHEKDGSPRIHRTVTQKIAIGLPPEEGRNYPVKLDHFVFLKQEMVGKELKWVVDAEKQSHYTEKCKEFFIVLLDQNPEVCFRTEFAAYVKTRCWCRGDGEKAQRRQLAEGQRQGDIPKGEFAPWRAPCANHGCPELESGACKPSADLYFILEDYPTLGTVCRLHTSSYQSIRQIWSALQDFQAITGGRLMGLRCKLFVAPARNVFEQNGKEQTGTKYVLGLELAAKDMPKLMESVASTALMFMGLQKQLGGATLEIEEAEESRAGEISSEFYHPDVIDVEEEAPQVDPEEALRAECDKILEANGVNAAGRLAKLSQHKGNMAEFRDKLRRWQDQKLQEANRAFNDSAPASSRAQEAPPAGESHRQQAETVTVASGVGKPAGPVAVNGNGKKKSNFTF